MAFSFFSKLVFTIMARGAYDIDSTEILLMQHELADINCTEVSFIRKSSREERLIANISTNV